jgi:hypothetical protein
VAGLPSAGTAPTPRHGARSQALVRERRAYDVPAKAGRLVGPLLTIRRPAPTRRWPRCAPTASRPSPQRPGVRPGRKKGDGHLDEGDVCVEHGRGKDRPEGDGDRQVERFNFASVRLPDTRSTATSVAYARAANTITRGDAGQLSNEFTPVCSPSRGSEPSSRRLTRPPSGMPGHPLGSSRVAPPRTRQAAGERSWTCALLATAR